MHSRPIPVARLLHLNENSDLLFRENHLTHDPTHGTRYPAEHGRPTGEQQLFCRADVIHMPCRGCAESPPEFIAKALRQSLEFLILKSPPLFTHKDCECVGSAIINNH